MDRGRSLARPCDRLEPAFYSRACRLGRRRWSKRTKRRKECHFNEEGGLPWPRVSRNVLRNLGGGVLRAMRAKFGRSRGANVTDENCSLREPDSGTGKLEEVTEKTEKELAEN